MDHSTFKYDNNVYSIVTQTTRGIIALDNSDDCCCKVIVTHENDISTHRIAKESIYTWVSRVAARDALTIDGLELRDVSKSTYLIPTQNSALIISALSPLKVPGTSEGSSYTVIATTPNGYVARRDGDGMVKPRIRVVRTTSKSFDSVPGYQWIYPGKYKWSTIDYGHVSFTAHNITATALTVACGINLLLQLDKVF